MLLSYTNGRTDRGSNMERWHCNVGLRCLGCARRVVSITKITTGCTTVATSIPGGFDRPRARPACLQKRIVRPFKLGLSYSYAPRVDMAPRVCIAIHCCDKLSRTLAPSQCRPRSVPFERGPPQLGTRLRE